MGMGVLQTPTIVFPKTTAQTLALNFIYCSKVHFNFSIFCLQNSTVHNLAACTKKTSKSTKRLWLDLCVDVDLISCIHYYIDRKSLEG